MTPFRFENMQLLTDGFKELVGKWWTKYMVTCTISHCLAEKVKALKKDLREWNKELFGNVSVSKSEAFAHVQFWDSKESVNPLSLKEAKAKKRALEDYKKWVLLEETQ